MLDYHYFKENYKIIAIDLSKQQALDADPRAIHQINFTSNLDRTGNTTMFYTIEEDLDFHKFKLYLLQDDGDVPTCIFSQHLNLVNIDGDWGIINTKLNGSRDKLTLV